MAHNSLHSALSKARNFIAKPNSKTQQLKKEKMLENPQTKIVCNKCEKSNVTLYKVSENKYLCKNCRQMKGE